MTAMEMAVTLARGWLGSMFLYTAGMKLGQYRDAGRIVQSYNILPRRGAQLVGLSLPWVELLSGLAVLSRRGHRVGATLSAVLGASFMFAAVIVLKDKRLVPCGCTGREDQIVDLTTVLRGAMIVLSAGIALMGSIRGPVPLPAKLRAAATVLALLPNIVYAQRHRTAELAIRHASRERQAKVQKLETLLQTQLDKRSVA